MRRQNRKSFNWYATKQRFSLRKYHFGVASVLLGLSFATGSNQAVQAETVAVTAQSNETATKTSATTDESSQHLAHKQRHQLKQQIKQQLRLLKQRKQLKQQQPKQHKQQNQHHKSVLLKILLSNLLIHQQFQK